MWNDSKLVTKIAKELLVVIVHVIMSVVQRVPVIVSTIIRNY
jgi:hypothetical protein